jgi:hypothetical protein
MEECGGKSYQSHFSHKGVLSAVIANVHYKFLLTGVGINGRDSTVCGFSNTKSYKLFIKTVNIKARKSFNQPNNKLFIILAIEAPQSYENMKP